MDKKWRYALDEFVNELGKKYGDKIYEIIVFGSYVRGNAKDESDIDVLIVGDVELEDVIDVSYPLLLKYRVYISPIVMTKEYYEFLKSKNTSFIKNVLSEGERVHVRA